MTGLLRTFEVKDLTGSVAALLGVYHLSPAAVDAVELTWGHFLRVKPITAEAFIRVVEQTVGCLRGAKAR